MSPPLEGVHVVDLTRGVAGPYATKLLADYGADVLKLEPPGGDPSRSFGPFPGDAVHPERSGLFLHLNTNKHSAIADPLEILHPGALSGSFRGAPLDSGVCGFGNR